MSYIRTGTTSQDYLGQPSSTDGINWGDLLVNPNINVDGTGSSDSWDAFTNGPIYPGPQDRGNEETEGAGTVGILPDVQEMEIQSWFSANPGATAQEVFDVMQANELSPETVINAMGFDPESAMAQYNTFLNPTPAPTPVVPPTSTPLPAPTEPEPSMWDTVTGVTGDVLTGIGEKVDSVLSTIADITGMPGQQQVLVNPNGPTTVVFGTPQGNNTPITIGHLPTSGAPIVTSTGNATLDAIISKIFNSGGPNASSGTWADIARDAVFNAVGVPAGADMSGALDDLIDEVTKVGVNLDSVVKEQGGVIGAVPTPEGETPNVEDPRTQIPTGTAMDVPNVDGPRTGGDAGGDTGGTPIDLPGGVPRIDIDDLGEDTGPVPEPDDPRAPETDAVRSFLQMAAAPGRGVEVTTPDPAEIDYLYDFESIFANPAQAAMFASPTGVERVEEPQLLEYLMRNSGRGQTLEDLLKELNRK